MKTIVCILLTLLISAPMVNAQKKIKQTAGRDQLGDFAPKFAELNDDVLFGEVWSRTDKLGLRDRSMVTITALVSSGITDSSLTYHLQTAKKNGITRTEIAEILTQVGFYAGWPKAWAAFRLAKDVWAEESADTDGKAEFEREMIFPIGKPNDAFAQYFIGQSYQRDFRAAMPQQLAHTPCLERRRSDTGLRGRYRLVSGMGQTGPDAPSR